MNRKLHDEDSQEGGLPDRRVRALRSGGTAGAGRVCDEHPSGGRRKPATRLCQMWPTRSLANVSAMREILEAITSGATGEDIAALPLPETYRGAVVRAEEVGMFEGLDA